MFRSLYLIFPFLLFLITSTLNALEAMPAIPPGAPSRSLIILYEYGECESIRKTLYGDLHDDDSSHPLGLGAISAMFITALWQEAAPILVPAALWENLMEHRQVFDDFASLTEKALEKKYAKTRRFGNKIAIAAFREHCIYLRGLTFSFEKIAKKVGTEIRNLQHAIWNEPQFDKRYMPRSLVDASGDAFHEVQLYTLCAKIPIHRYQVKKIVDKQFPSCPMYLFIPKRLLSSAKPIASVLSLDVDNFPDVQNVSTVSEEKKNYSAQDYNALLVPLLKKILINNGAWVFYVSGHGAFSDTAYKYMEIFLKNLEKIDEIRTRYESLEKAWKAQVEACEHEKGPCTHNAQSLPGALIHQMSSSTVFAETCRENMEIFLKDKADFESQESIIREEIAERERENNIAGITMDQFTKLIQLFDTLQTRLLFYSSCSAGGKHAVDAFRDLATHSPLTIHYMVMADALVEAPSLARIPMLRLQYYHDNDKKTVMYVPETLINPYTGLLGIDCKYDFNHFFYSSHKAASLTTFEGILKSMCPIVHNQALKDSMTRGQRISNAATIRLPYEPTFNVIDLYGHYMVVGNEGNDKTSHVIIPEPAEVVFLAECEIATPLVIAQIYGSSFPAFVSLVPGVAYHTLNYVEGLNYYFTEIARSFFAIPHLNTTKVFEVKKLIAVNDLCLKRQKAGVLTQFNDIVFFNRLSGSEDGLQAPENGFILKIGKNVYGCTWPWGGSVPSDIMYRTKPLSRARYEDLKKRLNECKPLSLVSTTSYQVRTIPELIKVLNPHSVS